MLRCQNCGEPIAPVGFSWTHQPSDGGAQHQECRMAPVATPAPSGTTAVDGR